MYVYAEIYNIIMHDAILCHIYSARHNCLACWCLWLFHDIMYHEVVNVRLSMYTIQQYGILCTILYQLTYIMPSCSMLYNYVLQSVQYSTVCHPMVWHVVYNAKLTGIRDCSMLHVLQSVQCSAVCYPTMWYVVYNATHYGMHQKLFHVPCTVLITTKYPSTPVQRVRVRAKTGTDTA